MIRLIESAARSVVIRLEALFDQVFTPRHNPLYQLGALSFLFFWIIVATGIYLFVFFETSMTEAWVSIDRLTHEQWYLGGVMRSLHRYASAAMGVTVTVHLLREFSLGRFRGARTFSWLSGVPLLWLLFGSAIGGYILVWDQLAQYAAIATTEWLDWLPVLGDPLARNFLTARTVSDRLFSLLVFLHIAMPLFLLVGMLIHIKRIKLARTMPPLGLVASTGAVMVMVSLVHPAVSMPPANLAVTAGEVNIDWVFMNLYPLLDSHGPGALWAILGALTVGLLLLPRISPLRAAEQRPAVVDPANCNGCTWCFQDCPFEAVTILPHDYKPGLRQAHVDPDLCTGCGICAGACPSATPFRHVEELVSGIEIPDYPLDRLRQAARDALARLPEAGGTVVFGCDCAARVGELRGPDVAALSLPCIALLPPSFVDFISRQPRVASVVVSGCHPQACFQRLGSEWVAQRMNGARSPHLRTSVGHAKVGICWAGPFELDRLAKYIAQLPNKRAHTTDSAAHASVATGPRRESR